MNSRVLDASLLLYTAYYSRHLCINKQNIRCKSMGFNYISNRLFKIQCTNYLLIIFILYMFISVKWSKIYYRVDELTKFWMPVDNDCLLSHLYRIGLYESLPANMTDSDSFQLLWTLLTNQIQTIKLSIKKTLHIYFQSQEIRFY